MTLIDLPGSAWLRIARCLNPEQLADVIKVSRGVRATLLRHMPYPPRLEVELGGDRLTSAAIIQARAEECPQVHLCLRAAYEQSKEEATACAMQLLEAVGPSGRAVVCLTLRGLALNSMVPTFLVTRLINLRELMFHDCHFAADPHFHMQCVLSRVPQSWRIQFNDLSTFINTRQLDFRSRFVRSTRSSFRRPFGAVSDSETDSDSDSDTDNMDQHAEGSTSMHTTSDHTTSGGSSTPLRLRSIYGCDTSVRMLYDLPLLAGHITSLKLSNFVDFQDRLHYPSLIRTIGESMVNLRAFDTGQLYWVMRQAETEALLSLPHLTHVTVSCFVLETSLADRPCRWKTLRCTCWDGALHVPSLAYLPLHSLQEPLTVSSGTDEDPLRLETDGCITLRLSKQDDGRSAFSAESVDVRLITQAATNVLSHCGIRWLTNIERFLIWYDSEDTLASLHSGIAPHAVQAVLPLLQNAFRNGARLELAYVPLDRCLMQTLSDYVGTSLTQLTLFCCPLGHAVPTTIATHFPALRVLTLAGHTYDAPPRELDLTLLLVTLSLHTEVRERCDRISAAASGSGPAASAGAAGGSSQSAAGSSSSSSFVLAVSNAWAPVLRRVKDGLQRFPTAVDLKKITTVNCVTPKGVFPYKPEFEPV